MLCMPKSAPPNTSKLTQTTSERQSLHKLTHDNAGFILPYKADLFGGDDLIRLLALQHAILVNATLVSECVCAHNRLHHNFLFRGKANYGLKLNLRHPIADPTTAAAHSILPWWFHNSSTFQPKWVKTDWSLDTTMSSANDEPFYKPSLECSFSGVLCQSLGGLCLQKSRRAVLCRSPEGMHREEVC